MAARECERTSGLTGLSGIWPVRTRTTSPAARSASSSTASWEKKGRVRRHDDVVQRYQGVVGRPDHVAQVLDAALQPAGLREALCVRAALGKDAVFEAGRRQGGAQVVGIADRGRVAEGDCGLDDAPVDGHLQPEAGPGLRLDGAGGHVLGLDHHGRAAGRGDDDVRAQSGMADDGLGVLGSHLPAGQHSLEQDAQGVVGVRLRLSRHIGL